MIQETNYNGYSANPSDYDSPDGDLALSLGAIPEDGSLRPLLPPSPVFDAGQGRRVVFIHTTAAFSHYIILDDDGNLYWADADEPSTQQPLYEFKPSIHSFEAVGNTLLVLTESGMHYILWKAGDASYLYLGTHLPECPISFGLQGEMVRSDQFSITFEDISESNIWNEFTDSNKTTITNQVLAKVNKFIAENSTQKGKFLFPFLVRYAYRLYDDSLTMHSSPVLMVASSDLAPQVYWDWIGGQNAYNMADLTIVGVFHTLDYAVVLPSRLGLLEDWKDIIRSIDIFVSAPIYTYDQNGLCSNFAASSDIDTYSICKHVNQAVSSDNYPLFYQKNSYNKMYGFTFNPHSPATYPAGRLMLPRRSVGKVKEDIRSCSQFYLLRSIKVEDLKSERTAIEVAEDYLQSLVTREVMTDDYDSHDTLVPQYAFAYNQRLNIANIKKELYNSYNAGALLQYTDGYVDASIAADTKGSVTVYFFVKQDARDIVLQGESFMMSNFYSPFLFIYYPNVNAYKAVVVQWNNLNNCYELPLEEHDFLNGAFYFDGWENPRSGALMPSESPAAQRVVSVPNKLYTSEVNNPFFFPLLGINTVGTGTILGISAAARALSQGQFGQFPLYAFTTDGVWALEVGSNGMYTARQPITRDVCINPDSITQIDSAVLFATDRGIMLISGSQTVCISDSLKSQGGTFSITSLPRCGKLLDAFNARDPSGDGALSADNVAMLPFIDFLADCRMVYDYVNQRIVVYNTAVEYAYVFSLKSKLWGMMRSHVTGNVNAYPRALAVQGSLLVDFSSPDATSGAALIVTRPFRLGGADTFKTIDTIIQRGHFRRRHVAQVLYGSNDLFNWHIVRSSADHYLRGFRGTPYKAFRLALVCRLDSPESLRGFTTQFTPRLVNQPR